MKYYKVNVLQIFSPQHDTVKHDTMFREHKVMLYSVM